MQNTLRQIKNIIHRLKRQFGIEILIKKPASSNNVQTGEVTRTYTSLTVKRAVVMPAKRLLTDSSLGQLKYGGTYDASTRVFIVDVEDLGSMILDSTCSIFVTSGSYTRQFNVLSVSLAEHNQSVLIESRELDATKVAV